MEWKKTVIKPFARFISQELARDASSALEDQDKIFHHLILKGRNTRFGLDHNFERISDHRSFIERVPIRDYEGLKVYFDEIAAGHVNVCWPGKPKYLSKTSGTTSGVKYIPITSDSLNHHVHTARNALLNYAVKSGNFDFLEGRMIFLSGSPALELTNGIPTGRLSGIVNHQVPFWLKPSQVPSYEVNTIEDWEKKVEAIVRETLSKDMRLISGIPPWVQMYYERLLEFSGKDKILDIFPNYSVFVFGGVNYEPYRQTLEQLVGAPIDSVETYPASEGFIAFQDLFPHEGLLLNTNAGMFFEFIPLDEVHHEEPARLGLKEVKLNKDYVVILSSNAGLWAYNIGDTIRFTSLNPYRVIVSGRVKHYISAFGEHVIGKEVESAIIESSERNNTEIVEFTVAPQMFPSKGLPHHEWFIEFEHMPEDLDQFARDLDVAMCKQNIYYKDLIEGKILQRLKIQCLNKGTFRRYMESRGKLGGQNKVPRLSNDRKIVEQLIE